MQDLGFSNIDKLEDLRTALNSEGKEVIKDAESMTEAWDKLGKVYGDWEIEILKLVERLHSYSPPKADC